MSDHIEQFSCIALQSFTIGITLLGFIAHMGLGVFYYLTTGTFPIKENILARVDQLKKTREDRIHHRHHHFEEEEEK